MKHTVTLLAIAGSVLAVALAPTGAAAQDYPSRPIRIIVPYAPGGGTDLFSRTVADHLSKKFKQPVIVDNKPGANTLIGNQAIAAAAPDGYTIGMISSATTSLPSTMKGFTTNPVKDFSPITQLVTGNYALVAHPSLPVKTVAELIAYAKANPGKLNFGSSGGSNDLVISMFKQKAGVNIASVNYKGIALARQALLANEIQLTLDVVGVARDMTAAGRMKFLAVTGDKRDPLVPEAPTVGESGLPGFSADFWWGYGGPAGMPADIVKKLHEGIAEALKTEVLRNQIRTNGNIPVGNSPEEFARIIASDTAMWTAAAKAAGITPD
ncbi:MAG TPA: tripartite tricarboxylate transporter substrate binding protein [Ramlibacter sp.]|nr:tripartite tricarboxylate transporter substrate binding protein [Ramlibacter sp.]